MKFQYPSFKFFLNGRTNKRTDGQAESKMLPTFFQSCGHKNQILTSIKGCIPVANLRKINDL